MAYLDDDKTANNFDNIASKTWESDQHIERTERVDNLHDLPTIPESRVSDIVNKTVNKKGVLPDCLSIAVLCSHQHD